MRECQKRLSIPAKETYILGKETYECTSIPEPRGQFCPAVAHGDGEVCGTVKRGLFIWQKRPTNVLAYQSPANNSVPLLHAATVRTLEMMGKEGGLYDAYVIMTPSERDREKKTWEAADSHT